MSDVVESPDVPETPESPDAPDTTATEPQIEAPKVSPDELNALRRKLAEAERREKRMEAERKKAAEEKAAEEGKWQELAQQREQELNEARERAERVQREQLVSTVAARMKFIDPGDVTWRLSPEDAADEATVESSLEKIAQASPHLVAKENPAAPEIGVVKEPTATPPTTVQTPAGKAPLRTQADVEALSDAEFNARYAEVQQVLNSL